MTPPRPLALALELATVNVLWRRDLARFFREKSRVAGAFLQPLIVWWIVGTGFRRVFAVPGARDTDYRQYLFPGILVMIVLFTAIFLTMSIIEDRREGFVQGVLAGPGSRLSLVIGKCVGVTSVAAVQSAGFLVLLPWIGIPWSSITWPLLALAIFFGGMSLAAVGFALAWWLGSVQSYHVVMSIVLVPAWFLSGAFFPASQSGDILAWVQRLNPVAYVVETVRAALTPNAMPAALTLWGSFSAARNVTVLLGFMLAMLALATLVCYRKR